MAKKVFVNSSVQRVIEDKFQPNSIRTGLVKALASGGDIAAAIVGEASNNLGRKVERMYKYARDHYPYGLQSGSFQHPGTSQSAVEAICEDIVQRPVTFDYSRLGPFNFIHYGFQVLYDSYGYNPITNVLGFNGAYLEDMVAVIPEAMYPTLEAEQLMVYGKPPASGYTPIRPLAEGYIGAASPPEISSTAVDPFLRVTYVWQDAAYQIHRASFNIAVPDLSDNHDYFFAKYRSSVNTAVEYELGVFTTVTTHYAHYFFYQQGEGTYVELDEYWEANRQPLGQFMPNIYFRFNGARMDTDHSTAAYQASSKMMNIMGMDYAALAADINSNPNIDDVEQAFLTFGVRVDSDNQHDLHYLYDFFLRMYLEADADEIPIGITTLGVGQYTLSPVMYFELRDALFRTHLSVSQLTRKRHFGTIGSIGSYQRYGGNHTFQITLTDPGFPGEGPQDSAYVAPFQYTADVTVPFQVYRKQITHNVYDEIRVDNIRVWHTIFRGFGDMPDPLIIPLDHTIVETYKPRTKEILYSRSMHYVFNSAQEVAVKWYQTGFFKFVMLVIALVITFYSGGGDGGQALAAAIGAATASLEAFIWTIIIVAIEVIAVRLALKLVVKLIGAEAALILSLVLMAVAAGGYMNVGGVDGAPWASDLLQVSTGLLNAANDSMTEAMLGIKSQAEAFGLEMAEKNKELETAKHLLENNNLLSPFVIFGETPTNYYERTVHSGNIGINSIGAISSYVENALTLPILAETAGDFLT